MTKYIRSTAAVALMIAAACSGDKNSANASQDSTLNKDLSLANTDTSAKPQLADVPATAAHAKTSPAPEPRHHEHAATGVTKSGNTVNRTPVAESAVGTIPSGSNLSLSSNARVCTNTNHVGDHVTATVSNTVNGSNGAAIPSGATATLEITTLKRSENANDKIQMGFNIMSVSFGGHTYPVSGTTTSAQVERVRNEPTGKDVQKVGIGAAAGAIAGKLLGHSTKATVIGGALGAAAGAGTAVATANYEGCVPQSGTIAVTLNSPVQVHQ